MNETTKFLEFGENIPVQMRFEMNLPQAPHWHNYIELFYVLEGAFSISVVDQEYQLSPDELILVNPFELHASLNEGARLAVYTIDLSQYDQHVVNSSVRFNCCSLTSSNEKAMIYLKTILAKFVKNNAGGYLGKELINKSLSYELLHVLVTCFSAEISTSFQHRTAQMKRMESILEYTNRHYAEPLTLSDLASRYYLTVPYMSKFFKSMMGTTFTDYMNKIRISHVVNSLSHHDFSTEELAEKNGFPNAQSLVSAFRKQYKMTPSQYKRRLKTISAPSAAPGNFPDMLDVAHTNHFGILSQYLNTDSTIDTTSGFHRHVMKLAPISVNNAGYPFPHTFQTVAALGHAKEILFSENQRILQRIQKNIGFQYLCFHGLLDDDMMLYSEDIYGRPDLSFSMIDAVFDFLKSIHLRPVLELSFMPRALAADLSNPQFTNHSIVSLPKDMEKWVFMIRGLIYHLMDRYGDQEVETWPIYLWNAPDLQVMHLGNPGLEDYYQFYMDTWRTVKKCNKRLKFGAPNFTNHTMEDSETFRSFIHFAHTNDCMPDFLCMNYFSTDLFPPDNLDQTKTNLLLRTSADALKETLQRVHRVMKENNAEHLTLHICEWNSTISHRELLNDTAFKSAYVVKNLLENYGNYDTIAYWTLSDLIEEVKLSGQYFHGGLGMFTFNGIPKAVYHAYELLAQLGDTLIAKGDGYIMTKSTGEWQILLYNYQHYSALYAAGELFDMTPTDRYKPFDQPFSLKYVIPIEQFTDGNYTLFETIINQEHGSSFDKWAELGADTLIDSNEQQYLSSSSIPKMQRKTITVENKQVLISCELAPHEVRFIKIRRQYTYEKRS